MTDNTEYEQLLAKLQELATNEYALFRAEEVRILLRCKSVQHIYDLFDRGMLRWPKDKPRRVFAWSVKSYLEDMNTPAAPKVEAAPQPKPRKRLSPGPYRFFRHLD